MANRTLWMGVLTSGLAILVVAGCRRSDPDRLAVPSTTPSAAADPCARGESVDPPRAEMEPARVAFEARRYSEAMKKFDVMAEKYPYSATVRVWRAEATLYQYKRSDGSERFEQAASDALPFYRAAEALHEKGCRLPDEAEYYLRMGAAYAHLRKRDASEAAVQLRIARKTFPDSAEATYALARASCLLELVDDCAKYFEETLRIGRELRRPIFLRTHRSMEEWIRRSTTQTEFEPLRRDPRYQQILKEARAASD